ALVVLPRENPCRSAPVVFARARDGQNMARFSLGLRLVHLTRESCVRLLAGSSTPEPLAHHLRSYLRRCACRLAVVPRANEVQDLVRHLGDAAGLSACHDSILFRWVVR